MTGAVLWLLACGGSNPPPATGFDAAWGNQKSTQAGNYQVEIAFEPDPPALSDLFTVMVVLRDRAGQPIEDATVTVNALMPHHGHGMMTAPRLEPGTDCTPEGVCTHPGGIYTTSGFKFHMGGPWTVTVQVDGPNGPDDTSFIYEMGL